MSVEDLVLRGDGIGLRHHSVRVRGKFGVRSQRKDAVCGNKVVVIGSEGVLSPDTMALGSDDAIVRRRRAVV